MKKILITGANGFLGSHITRLLSKYYEIIIIIKDNNLSRLEDIRNQLHVYTFLKDKPEDIFDKHKIEAIVHTATNYGHDGNIPQIVESNLNFPLQLLNLGIQNHVKAFINTDTFYNPTYGKLRCYALSKKQFGEWAKILGEKIKVINLTIGIIFGPADHRNKFSVALINRMLDNEPEIELTEGNQKRHFLYIDEAAQIYKTVIENIDKIEPGFSDINIGSGETTSIRDYIQNIYKITNSKSKLLFGALPYRENEIMEPSDDISAILKLGWRPSVSLEEALTKTIEYERKTRKNENR